MNIVYLADFPQYIPELAVWLFGEWGHLNVGETLERRVARLQSHTGRPGIPTTLIALEGEVLLDSASLVANDLRSHPHLAPFLASVFVLPEQRRRGVGRALVQRIAQEARQLGFDKLYLITHDRQEFYKSMGWSALEEMSYRGEEVTLMQQLLGQTGT